MRKSLTGLTLVGALLAFGCGSDSDSLNNVTLLPTATATTITSTSSSTTTTTTSTSSTSTTSTATTKVTFVQLGGGNGTGSETSPFNTIQAAVQAAGEGETIFVYANTAAPATVEPGNITLKPGQKLVGQGAGLSFRTISAGARPVLGGSVTLADDSSVSGFEFRNTVGTAVVGNRRNNVTVSNNLFTEVSGVSIECGSCTGAIVVQGNTVNRTTAPSGFNIPYAINAGTASYYDKTESSRTVSPVATILVADNVVSGGNETTSFISNGINLSTLASQDFSTSSVIVRNNTVSYTDTGVYCYQTYNAAIDATTDTPLQITGNQLLQTRSNGVYLYTYVTSTSTSITGNLCTQNSNSNGLALYFYGQVDGTISGNTLRGVTVDGDTNPSNNPVATAQQNGTGIYTNVSPGSRINVNGQNLFDQLNRPMYASAGGYYYTGSTNGALRFSGNTVQSTGATPAQIQINATDSTNTLQPFRVVLANNTMPSTTVQVAAANAYLVTAKFVSNAVNALQLVNSNNGTVTFNVENLGDNVTTSATFGSGLRSTNTFTTTGAAAVTGTSNNGTGGFTSVAATAGDQ